MAIVDNDYAAYVQTSAGEVPLKDLNAQEALEDIKVGWNGTTYDTPGDAVRGQVGSLSEEIKKAGASLAISITGIYSPFIINDNNFGITVPDSITGFITDTTFTTFNSKNRSISFPEINVDYAMPAMVLIRNNELLSFIMKQAAFEDIKTGDVIIAVYHINKTKGIIKTHYDINMYPNTIRNDVNINEKYKVDLAIGVTGEYVPFTIDNENKKVSIPEKISGFITSTMFVPFTGTERDVYYPEITVTYGMPVTLVIRNKKPLFIEQKMESLSGGFLKNDIIIGVFHMSQKGVLSVHYDPTFYPKALNKKNIDNSYNVVKHEIYRIFKKVVCCGDSYTSGHIVDKEGVAHPTNEEFAWPHYMGLMSGNEYVNCGKSGANAKTWLTSERGLAKAISSGKAQAYIIGLAINDSSNTSNHLDIGTPSDIGTDNKTYYGCYSKIIRELHAINNDAIIFVQTLPRTGDKYDPYNEAVEYIANLYKDEYHVHVLDLLKYKDTLYSIGSITGDSIGGHYTAIGYAQFAKCLSIVMSDYISENIEDFQEVAFIPYD